MCEVTMDTDASTWRLAQDAPRQPVNFGAAVRFFIVVVAQQPPSVPGLQHAKKRGSRTLWNVNGYERLGAVVLSHVRC
jgi:hypothetical protein